MVSDTLDIPPPLAPLTEEAIEHGLAQFDRLADLDQAATDALLSGFGVDAEARERVVPLFLAYALPGRTPDVAGHVFGSGFWLGVIFARIASEYANATRDE